MIRIITCARAPMAIGLAVMLAWPIALAQAEKGARAGGHVGEEALKETDRLRQRVEQLEEQLVDMQVLVGTLETLANRRSGAFAPASDRQPRAVPFSGASGGGSSGVSTRLETVETQIRALSGQIAHLTRQVRALETGGAMPATGGRLQIGGDIGGSNRLGPNGSASAGSASARSVGPVPERRPAGNGFRTEIRPASPGRPPGLGTAGARGRPPGLGTAGARGRPPGLGTAGARGGSPGLGTTGARGGPPGLGTAWARGTTDRTGVSSERDPIGNLLASEGANVAGSARRAVAALSDETPKALYERAYGYLLQQDYGAAETSFRSFLERYPRNKLVGNAQYWLGESYYVRGQYGKAAKVFLEGYRVRKSSIKAPDSLLKLAMSLGRLGEKEQACAAFSELTQRFPSAPAHVKRRARQERRRAGC